MTCEYIFWVRTARDSRDEASRVGSITADVKAPLQLARKMDGCGGDALTSISYMLTAGTTNDDIRAMARGHGVTVVYPSGRKRTVRQWD